MVDQAEKSLKIGPYLTRWSISTSRIPNSLINQKNLTYEQQEAAIR
jgi:hypothetical protein